MRTFLLNLIFLICSSAVFGQVEFIDHAIPEFMTSSRNLGMGNANFGEDFGPLTVFTNPASKLPAPRKGKLGIINVTGEFNTGTFDNTFGKEGVSFDSFKKGIDFLSQNTMRNALVDAKGGLLYQRLGVLSYYQFKRLTVGHFSSHFSQGALVDENSDFYGNRREDHGPYLHYSTYFGRRILFGLTYVYLNRSETESRINVNGDSVFNTTRSGTTNHVTLGFKFRWTRKFLVSYVNRDTFSSSYFAKNRNGGPRNDPNSHDLAFTYFASRNRLKTNLVFRDVTGAYDEIDSSRKIQLGINYSSNAKSTYKFGFMDSGITLGYAYKFRKAGTLSFSTYEVDTSITRVESRDRRFTFEYTL